MSRIGLGRLLPEVKPGQIRDRPIRNGGITLALVFAAMYFLYSSGSIPLWPKDGYTIKAEFASSANVTPGKTPVRYRGVEVGTVEKLERRPNADGVTVTMRIDKDEDEFRLRRDARADILWRTLLGFAFYIELDEGSDPAPLPEGGTIPLANTSTQVEADQVLAAVDAPSRAGIRALFREFDEGFNAESEAGRAIDRVAPAMRQVGPGVDALRGTQAGDLTRTVREAGRLMSALGRDRDALGGVVTSGATTLGVTAARRANIGGILRNGRSTLDETTATMRRTRTTLEVLDPVAQDLRPGARRLDEASRAVRPALVALDPLLVDARPTLADLRPALRRLRGTAREGTPFLKDLEVPLDRTNNTILPGLEEKSPMVELPTYSLIGPTFSAVSASASLFDANGHVQKFTPFTPGERALGPLPCSTNLYNGVIDCSDITKVIGSVLGVPPTTSAPAPGRAAGSARDAGTAARSARPANPLKRTVKTLKELL
jgi:virulence factor Mce-like protein